MQHAQPAEELVLDQALTRCQVLRCSAFISQVPECPERFRGTPSPRSRAFSLALRFLATTLQRVAIPLTALPTCK